MAIDFTLAPEHAELQARIRTFIADQIIPLEVDPRRTPHGPTEDLRRELIERGRQAGLLSPHVAREYGGMALTHMGRAIAFEEAGYSPLGPIALNVFAPDEGNMHLLDAVATPVQKERWLRPLASAAIRSCFCMTEPPPGAGSDPSMLATRAVRDGDDYVIDGGKWFITGAEGAAFAIVMANVSDAGATMFLSDMNASGIVLERTMGSLDSCFPGGHGVVRLEGLRVPAANVLGEVGKGFKYAQVRLSPARLTHCMRWLGMARRALEIALPYIGERRAFGQLLSEKESVQGLLGEAAMGIETGRLLTMRAALRLEQGGMARAEVSMAKIQVADALHRAVDTAIQLLGARGYSKDTPLEWMYRYARQARLVDGASEVHRMVVARELLRDFDMTAQDPA